MKVDPTDFVDLESESVGRDVHRRLLDAAPDAVVVTDTQGRIVLVNVRTESLFGYSRDDLIGQPVETLIPERFRTAHVGHRTRYVAAPKTRPMGAGLELVGRRRDGSEFPLEISLSPLPTARGTLTSANIRDVTDRKASEDRIRRIQAHLLSAVESIQGAFAIFDVADRLVLCNGTYRRIWGSDIKGDVAGKTFVEILDANIVAGTFALGDKTGAQLHATLLAYHREPTDTIDLRSREGRCLRLVERRTADGGTVSTVWDVTSDVSREEELRSARSAAEAASSAKSEFLSSMSHELRTPLNAILGFAQLLQRDKKEPLSPRHRERVDHVVKGGEHLLRLIDEVLDLSRIEAGRVSVSPEPVSLAETLREVEATLRPLASRTQVRLVLEDTSRVPEVIADRTRFKQVLMNYGSNAIKYGRKGGTVIFRATALEGFVRISVIDDGLGIAREKQGKLFQPFQRAGQETGSIEGTGIGLTISKKLAELMEGRVGFKSEEGKGSEFWIELPSRRASVVPTREPLRDPNPLSRVEVADGQRHLVVYVEDNPSNIAFMEDLLADFEQVELVTAPTAEIGIELVRARQPRAVIMDIHLPGMDGFEAVRLLRSWPETKHIPVIALSAAAMVDQSKRIEEAGFHRYLTKPVDVDELNRTLAELLATERTP